MNPDGRVIHALATLLTASYLDELSPPEGDRWREIAGDARREHDALREERDTWRMVATRLARCSDEQAQAAFNACVREYGHPDYRPEHPTAQAVDDLLAEGTRWATGFDEEAQ